MTINRVKNKKAIKSEKSPKNESTVFILVPSGSDDIDTLTTFVNDALELGFYDKNIDDLKNNLHDAIKLYGTNKLKVFQVKAVGEFDFSEPKYIQY
jgi:hypothetical protein